MRGITDLGGALRIMPAYVVTIGAWMMQSHRRVKSWPSLGFQGGQLRAENETYWMNSGTIFKVEGILYWLYNSNSNCLFFYCMCLFKWISGKNIYVSSKQLCCSPKEINQGWYLHIATGRTEMITAGGDPGWWEQELALSSTSKRTPFL